MFGQPRCREWTPLATQQLRLRNLLQIVGYNIRPPDNVGTPCSYYFTLHSTTMSAPFYTSERIQSTHPKWRDIDSEMMRRMSCNNIVVRLWRRFHPLTSDKQHTEISDLKASHNDIIVQTWGVYFNGLMHVGSNLALDFTAECFKPNTLVFQMHGGFFCSTDSLRLERLPTAVNTIHKTTNTPHRHTSSTKQIPIERRLLGDRRPLIESKSHSPSKTVWRIDNHVSRSHSPPTAQISRRPAEIYEHSPTDSDRQSSDSSKEDLANVESSENAENLNAQVSIPKCRYSCLRFLKSEIRPSYNASKLQKLHLLQYTMKKRKEAVADIKQRIYEKSSLENSINSTTISDDSKHDRCPFEHDGICDGLCSHHTIIRNCLTVNLFTLIDKDIKSDDACILKGKSIKKNGRISAPDDVYLPNDRKFTLSLNKLLEIKSHPSPMQRMEFTRLTKQQEILRFKRKLLSEERDTKMASIRHLREIKNKLFEENQDLGSELMQGYHSLSKSVDRLKKRKQSNSALEKLYGWAAVELEDRRQKLLADVKDIYAIDYQNWDNTNHSRPSICGIPLAACSDEDGSSTQQDPSETAAAAGFAAMATRSAAVLLSKPLRYEIKPLGSRSKIIDPHTPGLVDRDIPLFARNRDMTLFRYGLFLLNKDISQLLWSRGIAVSDIRPTLKNLNALLSPVAFTPRTLRLLEWSKWGNGPLLSSQFMIDEAHPLQGHHAAHSLRSLVALSGDISIHDYARRFNRFKDCIDGQSPSAAMTIRHRYSRSVGSYNDEQALQAMEVTSSMIGSEPSLLLFDMQLGSDGDLKSNDQSNSFSANQSIDTSSPPEKVIFSIGDSSTDVSTVLVKMSGNNGDLNLRLDGGGAEEMGAICMKIGELLTDEDEAKDDSDKHGVEMESFCLSEPSENSLNESVLQDVIVIQSAEAKLDCCQENCCDTPVDEKVEYDIVKSPESSIPDVASI